ncbi:MAG: tetratricopeptide repeat protein [Gammaproteobacteria bacterium]|nr:tetratricopeptide repeat protein [Gammaproteobacteria bacterium]
MVRTFFARLLFAFSLCLLVPAPATADVLDEARALLKAGQAQKAYAMLAPLEESRAGDPEYDYLLGVSALDSGNPGLAVFALERVLAVRPDHAAARADLARAYFELRDDQAAKQEFDNVAAMNPPDPVARTIERYLQALDLRFKSIRRTQWRAYAQAGFGADSNVNSATDDSQVAIPALGNLVFQLARTGQETGDAFIYGEAGGTVGHRIGDTLLAFASGRIYERVNESEHEFDTGVIDFTAGLSAGVGKDTYTGALQLQRFEVGNSLFRTITGVTGQYRRIIDNRNQLTLFGQLARLRFFPVAQSLRDVQQVRAGAGWAHSFGGEHAPTVYASAYVGDDEERSGLRHLGRRFYGARIGGDYKLRSDVELFGSAAVEVSDYGGTEPLFLRARDDDYYEFAAGLRYRGFPGWTITPEARYSRNDSTIPVNEFRRFVILTTVRYDFR